MRLRFCLLHIFIQHSEGPFKQEANNTESEHTTYYVYKTQNESKKKNTNQKQKQKQSGETKEY